MREKIIIYWVRRDFRLADNPALWNCINYASDNKQKILPIFILDEKQLNEPRWNIGYPRRFLLSKILASFALEFDNFEILIGSPAQVYSKLFEKYDITIFANKDIEPYARKRDAETTKLALENKSKVYFYQDQISIDVNTRSKSDTIYSVFSPFRKAVLDQFLGSKVYETIDLNKHSEFFDFHPDIDIKKIKFDNRSTVNSLESDIFKIIDKKWELQLVQFTINLDEILDRPDLDKWYYTEMQAIECFQNFNDNKITKYKQNRDSLELDTEESGQTSKISTALKWGLISPRFLVSQIQKKHDPSGQNVFSYISELIWREFYRYILYHNPNVLFEEFQEKYRNKINWNDDKKSEENFIKWIRGETGYKAVDAAMNQIAKTGWMHNRARMIVASFLTKHLGIDWRWGQEYFRAILVDLDEASNNGGWQWASSVGSDPKPIRIFNPYTQAERYDPQNKYIEKWLPSDYSITEPIVEHKQARQEALERYKLAKDTPARDY